MLGGRRVAIVVGVLLLAVALGGYWLRHRGSPVYHSPVRAAATKYEVPSYAVVRGGRLVVVQGDKVQRVLQGRAALWLPGGQVLVDVASGRKAHNYRLLRADGRLVGEALSSDDVPSRPGGRIDLWQDTGKRNTVQSYSTKRQLLETIRMPGTATKGPADNPFERTYRRDAVTVADTTFAIWSDGNDQDTGGSYGVVMVTSQKPKDVLVEKRIVDLRLSADGSSVLAIQQTKGKPCAGCVVAQQIVEINPRTGHLAGHYGVPDGYQKTWRVDRVDKVGDVVAVRYVSSDGTPIGTFTFDGSWSKVKGSDQVEQWWQGPDDRIELRGNRLFAVHGSDTTPIAGILNAIGGVATGSIPGTLIAPTS